MLIEILDDFDLEKIALSGQCFRVRRMQDEGYRFIFGDEVLYRRLGIISFLFPAAPMHGEILGAFTSISIKAIMTFLKKNVTSINLYTRQCFMVVGFVFCVKIRGKCS